jgi:hypothetical protein
LASQQPCAIALPVLVALGCLSEADHGLDLPPIAGCESEAYAPCDIHQPVCQARVFATVSCLRGTPDAPPPEVRTITQSEYEAELSAPPTGDREATPEAEAAALADNRSVERTLELLGLARAGDLTPASYVELFSTTVPGYYSSADRRVTLIEQGPGGRDDPGGNTVLLAHELVHALQDRDVGLQALYEASTTFDRDLATQSVIEGEASMIESFFAAAMWGLEGDLDFRSHFTSWVEDAEERFGDQSPLLVSRRYFPYSYGARYVYNVFSQGGMPLVRDIYRSMPQSVLPMMLSVDSVVELEVDTLAALSAPAATGDFELRVEDTLGPWVFSKFLSRALSSYAERQLSSRWRGDRFFVYGHVNGSVTGIWIVRFDVAAAAEQFAGLLTRRGDTGLSSSAFAVSSGRDVAVAVTDELGSQPDWIVAISQAQTDALASESEAEVAAAAPRGLPLSAALRQRLVGLLR